MSTYAPSEGRSNWFTGGLLWALHLVRLSGHTHVDHGARQLRPPPFCLAVFLAAPHPQRSPRAWGLTILEAVGGQMYLAVLVARLVSLYSQQADE